MESSSFLLVVIAQIEDYYGIKLSDSDKNDIDVVIHNKLLFKNAYVPKYFRVEHKGEIVEGRLGNIANSDLLSIREQNEKKVFTEEDWRKCLMPLSNKLAYCEASGIIYQNIEDEIRDWLNENGHCDLMYRLVCHMKIMPKLNGETAKIYDAFIMKGKNIDIKKDLFADKIDTDDNLWVIRYLESLYTDNKPDTFDYRDDKIFKQNASDFDIIYEDLKYRVNHGMTLMEAIDIGKQEKEQYGFRYKFKDSSNFINYLKYYIRNEKDKKIK